MSDVAPEQTESLARFRAAVLTRPAVQARLAAIFHPDEFVAAVISTAATLDIVLTAETVLNAIRPDMLGVARFQACAMESDGWPPLGWLPARSVPTGAAPAYDWTWFGPAPITRSFFEDDVRRQAAQPFNEMFRIRTTMDAVIAGQAGEATVPLSGLIFHMSRCGSTLAAQMLAAVPDHIVLSEPEPIDAVVQWAAGSDAPLADKVAALRAVVAALGRNRSGTAQRYFIKTDCWHTLQLPLFRAAFPDVPWLFLHRDPAEVMVSQAREPGAHFAPGVLDPAFIGVDAAAASSLTDYGARVLGRISGAVLDHWASGGGMAVDYPEIAVAMSHAIPAHFGFTPAGAELAAMIAAAGRNAKVLSATFRPDTLRKRAEVTPEIAAAVELHLSAHRRRLCALGDDAPR